MELYGITEAEVKEFIDQGEREVLQGGKTNSIHEAGGKF
jgi:hypothetical protein